MTEIGDLITPTGRLVMPIEAMRGDRAAWLAARRQSPAVPGGYRIGASEVPSILDLDGADTPAHVFRRKVYGIETPPNEAMTFGNLLEPIIGAEWARRNRVDRIDEIGLVARDGDPWAVVTIDRRVLRCPVFKDTPEGECLCEIKNMDSHSISRWHADIPDRILAQVLFQLWITGYGHGHVAALVGGNRLKQVTIYADREKDLTEYIVTEVRRFRTEHLLTGIEPAWDTSSKPDRMIELDKASHPERDGVAELGINEIDAVYEYGEAAAASSAAKKRQDAAKAELMRLASGASAVKFADELAYRFGPTTKTKVNLDVLSERYPEAYNDPEVVSETKSFTIYLAAPYKVRPNREDRT